VRVVHSRHRALQSLDQVAHPAFSCVGGGEGGTSRWAQVSALIKLSTVHRMMNHNARFVWLRRRAAPARNLCIVVAQIAQRYDVALPIVGFQLQPSGRGRLVAML
jgi:hypothetical protein